MNSFISYMRKRPKPGFSSHIHNPSSSEDKEEMQHSIPSSSNEENMQLGYPFTKRIRSSSTTNCSSGDDNMLDEAFTSEDFSENEEYRQPTFNAAESSESSTTTITSEEAMQFASSSENSNSSTDTDSFAEDEDKIDNLISTLDDSDSSIDYCSLPDLSINTRIQTWQKPIRRSFSAPLLFDKLSSIPSAPEPPEIEIVRHFSLDMGNHMSSFIQRTALSDPESTILEPEKAQEIGFISENSEDLDYNNSVSQKRPLSKNENQGSSYSFAASWESFQKRTDIPETPSFEDVKVLNFHQSEEGVILKYFKYVSEETYKRAHVHKFNYPLNINSNPNANVTIDFIEQFIPKKERSWNNLFIYPTKHNFGDENPPCDVLEPLHDLWRNDNWIRSRKRDRRFAPRKLKPKCYSCGGIHLQTLQIYENVPDGSIVRNFFPWVYKLKKYYFGLYRDNFSFKLLRQTYIYAWKIVKFLEKKSVKEALPFFFFTWDTMTPIMQRTINFLFKYMSEKSIEWASFYMREVKVLPHCEKCLEIVNDTFIEFIRIAVNEIPKEEDNPRKPKAPMCEDSSLSSYSIFFNPFPKGMVYKKNSF